VDEFGGIKDAIALAAIKAKLEQYTIVELPKQKEPFEEIINRFFDQEAMVNSNLSKEFGGSYENLKRLKNVLRYKGVQARMPYDVVIY
jgi:protease-4